MRKRKIRIRRYAHSFEVPEVGVERRREIPREEARLAAPDGARDVPEREQRRAEKRLRSIVRDTPHRRFESIETFPVVRSFRGAPRGGDASRRRVAAAAAAGRGGVPRARGRGQSEKFADERNQSRLAVHGVARARPLQAHVHVRVGPDRGETRCVRRLRRDEAAAADGEANRCLRVGLRVVCVLSRERVGVFASPSSPRLRDGSRDLEPLRREQRRGRARQGHRHVV